MPTGLMSIGTFSRASLLSIKALRAYHAAGILVPAQVDQATGYRAYLATQLTDAAVLRRLRAVDLPLSDVGEILRARDPDRTRKILTGHGELLQERMARIAQAVDEIQSSIEHPTSLTPVYVRDEPAMQTVEFRGQVREADFASFLDAAYAALYALLGRLGVPPDGPSGALYPPSGRRRGRSRRLRTHRNRGPATRRPRADGARGSAGRNGRRADPPRRL
ncbi:MAG: MerR family DNA-binding transcriptional regulator [Geodermatophilaceae bacterium]|nr:MerR family DNA-binding transcriptional regulator [Geodermatophilaceae bacterium]